MSPIICDDDIRLDPPGRGRLAPVILRASIAASSIWVMSLYHALKFANWSVSIAYLGILFGASCAIFRAVGWSKLPTRLGWQTSAAIIVTVVGILLLVYPVANVQEKGKGSDRDDALDQGAKALLRGEWPYNSTTYHGLPISPMPGALILATPFVAAGGSAWQIPAWLGLFAWTVGSLTRSHARAAAVMVLSVPAWLSMLQEIATGGDYNLNGIYVLCSCLWLIMVARDRVGLLFALAVVAGIALSSRLNYLVTLPCLLAAMSVRLGWKLTGVLSFTSAAVFVSVSLPFYLYDPPHFGPFMMQDKFGEIGDWASGRGWMFGIASVGANCGFAAMILMRRIEHLRGYLIGFVVATLIPGVVGSLLQLAISHDTPLFIRWTSGAIPCLLVLLVMPPTVRVFPKRDSGKKLSWPNESSDGQGLVA